MGIKGAILGDIIGSQFEFERCPDPQGSSLFNALCDFTDDTVTSLAIKYAIDNGILKMVVKNIKNAVECELS